MQDSNPDIGAGMGRGNFSNYILGYIMALLLSAISFGSVMTSLMPPSALFKLLVIAAILQVCVHLVCFLHITRASTPRWNIIVFGFAMIVVVILIGGSVWIMASAGTHMMPANNMTNLTSGD